MSKRSHRDRKCRPRRVTAPVRAVSDWRFGLDAPVPREAGRARGAWVDPSLPFWVQQECIAIASLGRCGAAGKAVLWILILSWVLVAI